MDRLVVDVVLQEVFVHAGQEGHLRQREDVHELLHGVSMGTLRGKGVTLETEAGTFGTLAELGFMFTDEDSGQHLEASP